VYGPVRGVRQGESEKVAERVPVLQGAGTEAAHHREAATALNKLAKEDCLGIMAKTWVRQ
jgi:hypothetical protein